MTTSGVTVQMAVIHRPSSTGIDLPAGASAGDLQPTDYHVIEMPDVGIQMATIHAPNDQVIEFPAGATFDQLRPTDFRVIEVGDGT
jgi:hypothetical protein